MNRLRDMDGDEPLFRRGSELLRGVTPTAPATEMKQRVWRSLQHAPAAAPRGVPSLMLKVAIGAIVALAAGTAGAVIAQRWIAPHFADGPGAPAHPIRSTHPVRAAARTSPTPATAPTPPVAPAPGGEPAVDSASSKPAARPTLRRIASAAPSAAAVARERTEVLDALVALRREHDPARAGTLLARYLSAHPRGAMREEALALAIEAADARGERAAAAQLAQAYQAEFPAGRFLIFARSHIERANSH